MMICMLENLDMTPYLAPGEYNLMGKLLGELYNCTKKTPKEYKSYLFQAISMSLFNNTKATLDIIEQQGQTIFVFGKWFEFMSNFKKESELRRIIFGLCSLIKNVAPQ